MTGVIQPIGDGERRARVEKARQLMRENKIGALVLEGGSSMFYFTGTRWPQGDRTLALVMPAEGDLVWIVPEADAERARGAIPPSGEIRTWTEAEGPYKRLAQALKGSRIGIEERVRFAVYDGLRKVITDAGFGPGYKVPGLPHRTGHGIGLDGHEWTNLVRRNKTMLQPGMCFSDEPTIAIYGEFGVRLEDCMHITEEGARMFTRQSPAIDQPFG
ncbi:MAG TPA: aminopeptidase P family protein [Bryobacteraceae bacterium]|nr:aminopeptidase P family protein [Bryobacteraceae bacterium]